MHNSKNLIFAIIFSTIILFAWQYFYVNPRLEQVKAQQEKAIAEAKLHEKAVIQATTETYVSREEALSAGGRIKIESPSLHGSISLKGARFDDLTLRKYKISVDKESPEVVLLSPGNTQNLYFAEFGWVAGDESIKAPNSNTIWSSADKILTEKNPITLFWDNGQGLKFYITIAIDDNYMFTVKRKVENYGHSAASLMPYGILSRTADTKHESFAILHEGALGVFDGILNETRWKDLLENKTSEYKNTTGWLGFTDKYWLTAIIPDKGNSFDSKFTYFAKDNKDRFQADYIGQQYDVVPGSNIEVSSRMFAGAKEGGMLDTYSKSLDIPLFDHAVDFGRLYFITKPLFMLLTFFHKLVGNFGVAILLLTIVVKLIMFPLANKSYVSMNQLKKMQPQVKEIHEKHKDDKMKANKAVMELYKEERINPMSGCMPMLIQIPVFFALYKVLFVTIEMRHAPFFGWIRDLSAPDHTNIFNLFGLIEWMPPSMLHIGAWPIIMAITMYLQQQMNPAPTDPIQAKVMKFLPLIFVFMFASFPAGLVIYWAWNNALSILQQFVLVKKMEKRK